MTNGSVSLLPCNRACLLEHLHGGGGPKSWLESSPHLLFQHRGLITASGLGDVEFARELFEELGVLSVEDRALWATIFRSARLPIGTA